VARQGWGAARSEGRHGRVGLCRGVRARGTVKVRPAAARRGGGRRRLRVDGRRNGSLHKNGTAAGRERGPMAGLQRAHRHHRQQGEEKRIAAVMLTGGAEGRKA
jgi:hypothetical protein